MDERLREVLRARMVELGLSYRKLSLRTGYSENAVWSVITGYAKPSMTLLKDLVDALGLHIGVRLKDDGRDATGN